MAQMVGALFGGGGPQGPSRAERAMQQERMQAANRADTEADARTALAARAGSLRNALSYRDRERSSSLGG